jgi:23S rRNA (cytidine1920-2'-O)/16S rRNA (cytidine1409-2'-O)-methyltransferase
LRVDPRVILLERVNVRDLTSALVPERIDLVVCDVSFISLRLALPPALALTTPGARLLALIKPQFEVGRDQVGKGGIVRDPGARHAVCEHIAAWVAAQPGWRVSGLIDSPIPGAEGNLEYLLAAVRSPRLDPAIAAPVLRV